jgi:hypothetical protein
MLANARINTAMISTTEGGLEPRVVPDEREQLRQEGEEGNLSVR